MEIENQDYEAEFKRFIDAGNFVNGRPEKIIGKFRLDEFKKSSVITFGKNVKLVNCDIRFPRGGGELILGDNVVYNALTHIGQLSRVIIGNGTSFNRHAQVHAWEGASITVGKNCLFSNIKFRTSDLHSIYSIDSNKRINHARDIVIGNRVWIAEAAVVGKGSRICDGSVIGAHAYVTGYIPKNCIAVGIPATPVRFGVRWDRRIDMENPRTHGAKKPAKAVQVRLALQKMKESCLNFIRR